MANETDTKWLNKVDPASISKAYAAAYAEQTTAYKAYRAAQEKAEAIARDTLKAPPGREVKFNYRFGLSIGIGAATPAKSPAKSGQSLTAWLAQQSA